MPFEFSNPTRIAIIGGGISGLAAAYELSSTHDVTLYEAEPRLGGHARTVMAGKNGDVPVDTGFIVFNYPNYPNLTRMFRELDVPVKKSSMSFAATIDNGRIEYGLKDFAALTAQTRNLLRPQFWRMISDILKFNKYAVELAQDPDMPLGEFLDRMSLGEWFRKYYLLPISGAIWSSTPEQMESFPARSLVQFFQNHALLSSTNHQWHTVDGGSREYVRRIALAIESRGSRILTGTPVAGVTRDAESVRIRSKFGEIRDYDKVIFACHSDQALALLEQPTEREKKLLGDLRYQANHAVLHRDENLMPKQRKSWASWVFQSSQAGPAPRIGITYWMNSLQGIPESEPLFVTLNPDKKIPGDMIYDETLFHHPVFDGAAIRAQQELPKIQGQNRTWYCGAYTRWGFHEDGYASAMNVVEALKAEKMPERIAAE